MQIPFQLESIPLHIDSHSLMESEDKVKVNFLSSQGHDVGGVTIQLSSRSIYLHHCSESQISSTTTLSSTYSYKVWWMFVCL